MPQALYLRLAGRARTKRTHAPRSMPTHKAVKVGGKKRRLPVAYFWKDVIGVGKYRHPITGQTFEVDEKRIDKWIEKYERMRGRGIEIPTPVDHSDRAEDNRGFVVGARRVGGRLQLLHQVIGEDGAKLACRNRCSVFIDPEFTDEHGKNWGEVIAHSAFTPKPVISGQGEFVPFAASRAIGSGKKRKVPVFYLSRKESDMATRAPGKRRGKKGKASSKLSPKKLAKIRKVLGIEEDEEVSDEELLNRLASLPSIRKAAKKALKDDEEEDDDDEDEEDTNADDELEDDADEDESDEDEDEDEEDTDAEDELEDSDEEDDEDEDEDDEDEEKKRKKGKNRKRVLAQRSKNRKRELAGSVGSLSRVPKDTDPTTLTLLRKSFSVERKRAIAKGAITPEVDEALCSLLFKGKQFNGLALSRMPGSEDPLAFRLYGILRRNKPIPLNGGRTGNQEAIALGRNTPGKNGEMSKKERDQIREEVRQIVGTQQGRRRKDKDEE